MWDETVHMSDLPQSGERCTEFFVGRKIIFFWWYICIGVCVCVCVCVRTVSQRVLSVHSRVAQHAPHGRHQKQNKHGKDQGR